MALDVYELQLEDAAMALRAKCGGLVAARRTHMLNFILLYLQFATLKLRVGMVWTAFEEFFGPFLSL